MGRVLIVVTALAIAGGGGGGGGGERGADRVDRTEPAVAGTAAPSVAAPAPAVEPPARGARRMPRRPLSSGERKILRMLARSSSAVGRYDATMNTCGSARWASCLDNAWRGIVTDLDWPPYYLRRFDTQSRRCEPLSNAANGIYGFNNGARQLDYSDPDIDTSFRRTSYLALVDGLRPVPSELLDAVASGCR